MGYAFKGIARMLEESTIVTLFEIPVRTPGRTDVATDAGRGRRRQLVGNPARWVSGIGLMELSSLHPPPSLDLPFYPHQTVALEVACGQLLKLH